jgi:DNA-binding NtrC family response regulator
MSLKTVVVVGRSAEMQSLAQQVSSTVFAADNLVEAVDVVERVNPDLVLFDSHFSPSQIAEFINITSETSNFHIVAIGDGNGSAYSCEHFIEAGVNHYLDGQQDYHRLKDIVKQVKNKLASKPAMAEDKFFLDALAASVGMVGKSSAIAHTLKMIKLVATSLCNPMLIIGETGTGKELAARAIHNERHPKSPFIAVNCAALTANLLESELFGHVKGSFTSADRDKVGLLEMAQDGTLFLDEISEMPMDLQAKLLRVLQEKTYMKVGGTKEIECKAVIVASSNRNLKNEVQANRFRADLYHRLNIFPIVLSPLRHPDRKKDIPLIAEFFLKQSAICPQKSGKVNSITPLALEVLQQYTWHGNVRELRNVIERAILLETSDKIGLTSIVIDTEEPNQFTDGSRVDIIKTFSLAKAEQELIARALQETNWQKTKAAELLGISRATLYAKVKQHNLASDFSEEEDYVPSLQVVVS